MSKYLLVLLTSLFIHFAAFAQGLDNSSDNSKDNFEAELQLLENLELEAENNQMRAVEKLTTTESADIIEDTVSNTQASALRSPIEIKPEPTMKIRRIRSR